MRNTLPLLSRTPMPINRTTDYATPSPPSVPTIRLTTATPAADTPTADGPATSTVLAPKAQTDTRKRLVPKKSKLNLLGSKRGEKGKDIGDVAHRVGLPPSSAGRSFDIYVDPADDPDIGEIVVLKKKKSRAGLDGVRWGTLGDVTNTGKEVVEQTMKEKPGSVPFKAKSEEKEKWWTIGRGRRDSKEKEKTKEKEKENAKGSIKLSVKGNIKLNTKKPRHSTSPERIQNIDSRQRSQSFDAGMFLNTSFVSVPLPDEETPRATGHDRTLSSPELLNTNFVSVPMPDEHSPRLTGYEPSFSPDLLGTSFVSVPLPDEQTPRPCGHTRTHTSPSIFGSRPSTPAGSAAFVSDKDKPKNGSIALRAMRSVSSLARIGSWAQLRNTSIDEVEAPLEKKSGKEKKREKRKKERTRSTRLSRSSFEALKGTFSRKSTDLSGTVRTVSSQATYTSTSSNGTVRNGKRHSGMSDASNSSIEPIIGRESKSSSGSSVRWDDQVETVKGRRTLRHSSESISANPKSKESKPRESRKGTAGRKRPALLSLFSDSDPSGQVEKQKQAKHDRQRSTSLPMLTLETASPERFDSGALTTLTEVSPVERAETPVKKARARPLSEQMIGRPRPRGIIGDEEGVIQILDAVTSDLASLINRLDLEATPNPSPRRATPGTTRIVRSRLNSVSNESPVKSAFNKRRLDDGSVGSLSPYAQHCGDAPSSIPILGEQIAPWPTFHAQLEAVKGSKFTSKQREDAPISQHEHKRGWSPRGSPPSPFEAMPVFHPLPAATRFSLRSPSVLEESLPQPDFASCYVSSPSNTFGERPARFTKGSITSVAPTPTRKRGKRSKGSGQSSSLVQLDASDTFFMDSKARLALGMRGTMGSTESAGGDLNLEDPDSDIPGELQVILGGMSDQTYKYSSTGDRSLDFERSRSPSMYPLPPSPGSPPCMPLPPLELEHRWKPDMPVFRPPSPDEGDETDIDGMELSDDETKKSFDFTGELNRLDSSNTSDRRSFVMQLEDAFKTPSNVDIRGLGAKLGEEIPEVPPLPLIYRNAGKSSQTTVRLSDASLERTEPSSDDSIMNDGSVVSDALSFDASRDEDVCMRQPLRSSLRGVNSKRSVGVLNMDFKFGGKPRREDNILITSSEKPLTLSDSLPSPSHRTRNQSFASSSESILSERPPLLFEGIRPASHNSRNQSFSSISDCGNSVISDRPLTLSDIMPPLSHGTRNQSFSSISDCGNSLLSDKPHTLSDIIPPPSHHTRNQSFSPVSEEGNSMLKSIFTKAAELSELSLSSDADAHSNSGPNCHARQEALAQLTAHSRQNSEVSFSGLSSYSEIRRGFEFGSSRPAFYPFTEATQSSANLVPPPAWRGSTYSSASVSSYGSVLRPGVNDPFDYGVPANMHDRPISEALSITVDDTFQFMRRKPNRQRVDSDASSYSSNVPSLAINDVQVRRPRRRQIDSLMSVTSGPPISLYNRGFSYYGHRRNDSTSSINSSPYAYNTHGINSGRATRTKHRRNSSVDSAVSGFSSHSLGRPGVGDKMFDSARDYNIPLSCISASPSQIDSSRNFADRNSFDSILDEDHLISTQDSLFDETGRRSASSSESVFGHDNHHPPPRAPGLLPPNQFRPFSVYSVNSVNSPKREDDTMISMLGGGHVRRRSIGSTFEGSPCVRAEKRRHRRYVGRVLTRIPSGDDYDYSVKSSPDRTRVISRSSFVSAHEVEPGRSNLSPDGVGSTEKPSSVSAREFQFGGDRMNLAYKGLLERQSLENCCLSGKGEDTSAPRRPLGVFRRPDPVSRNRSGSCSQSGADTPTLSICDTSSLSSGSQCSIDLVRLNTMLSNSTNNGSTSDTVRARARGQGHHRRITEARASRSSVYETIEEETPGSYQSSLSANGLHVKSFKDSASSRSNVIPYNEHEPDIEIVGWNNGEVGPALRKLYALKNEALQTVDASHRLFEDTPFSLYSLQCGHLSMCCFCNSDTFLAFDPPQHAAGMKALLEHSQKTYGPLPSDLLCHRRRSRTLSRPSPYPRDRVFVHPSNCYRPSAEAKLPNAGFVVRDSQPLKDVCVNANIDSNMQPPAPSLDYLKPFTPFAPFAVDLGDSKACLATKAKSNLIPQVPNIRPRVASNSRKNPPTSVKRGTGKSSQEKKENKENAAHGTLSSSAGTLRIVRPRPRGRPAAAVPRTLRV
ncbi:hypothetical protein DFH11DRAFT_933783 [Phellopilus nigrolimitatus]|nr:hypothetical protein DFH11DRAFT_933783 [Phellopilus nigrolimitatus]